MKKWMKWAAAAVFGAAVCCAGASLPASADASLDKSTGVLTLSGNVDKGEVLRYSRPYSFGGDYAEDYYDPGPFYDVRTVIAAEGAVLPEDCSYLFFSNPPIFREYDDYYNIRKWVHLKKVDLSKADGSKVKTMAHMFDTTLYLEEVNLSGLNTSSLQDMSFMFYECPSLKSINLSGIDTSNVRDMHFMFKLSCPLDIKNQITTLDLSSFDTSKVENMHGMFDSFPALKTIYVSDKWTTANLSHEEFEDDMDEQWYNQQMKYRGDTSIFGGTYNLTGGNGTTFNKQKCDADMACIDTAEHPGYLTGKQNKARGASITLAGELAVNFFLELHPDTAQIKVTGPENSVVPTGAYTIDASLFPNVYGKPREANLSYPINATQAGETITLEFLDSSGNPLPVYNSDGVRFADDKLTYSVQQYIDDTPLYSDNAKLKALVGSLDNYCRAAHNFFFHKNDPVYGIENVTIAQFEPYNYPLYGTEIALILNSKIEARIYSDNVIPEPFNGDGYLPTLFGTDQGYYFIYDIGAPQLASTETYQIGDTAFKFSPLTYGYYIMKKSDDESLKTLVRALYVYAQAAKAYPNGTD